MDFEKPRSVYLEFLKGEREDLSLKEAIFLSVLSSKGIHVIIATTED